MTTDEIDALQGPIAVFGAGGFIGARLFEKLMQKRSDVIAITRQHFIPPRLVNIPNGKTIQCDQRDKEAVFALFRTEKIKTVLLFSAYGAYSWQTDARQIYQTNFIGLLNILEASADVGISALVHAGSSSEYGTNSAGPKETDFIAPNSHYAVSKSAATGLLCYYGKTLGLPVVNLRLYSIYGPYEDEKRLIPQLMLKGMEGKRPPLTSPETSRDFVYIDDLVEATVRAAIHAEQLRGESFNIASGVRTSLADIVKITDELCRIKDPVSWGEMQSRHWDRPDWYGNADKAKAVLKWHAKTSLKDGLSATLRWWKDKGSVQ